ncbi:GNAT family N-acetyltransferase [Pinirhizobacter sp.]|uniref:GNAT family N-acetyltransferase n=1 Tax=Pinirhizobacter sp. TaxID=2950432 RepID=UPI002F41E839
MGLRCADTADLPFLRRLYAASRAPEFAGIPWPGETRQVFFDSQFDMQHRHYVTCYASADFLIVLRRGAPIGRLYLHQSGRELCIVDILLEQAFQGRGIGSALLHWAQASARERKLAALTLHVELRNEAARRLYERHGFVAGDVDGAHLRMTWQP